MQVDYKLLTGGPNEQNILDLFAGEWSTQMPTAAGLSTSPGHAALMQDPRIFWAADELGPLFDRDIIELGPLEGGHTYMLQQFKPRMVWSVEANTRAFLKCLCVQRVFNLNRIKFMLGSFFPFLEWTKPVDVMIASGVLYHMSDPLKLLDLVTTKSDRVFVWTHYFDEDIIRKRPDSHLWAPLADIGHGHIQGSRRHYHDAALSWNGFSGGGESYAIWLTKESIVGYFERAGFTVSTNFDQPEHVNGPSFALCAVRPSRQKISLIRKVYRMVADLIGISRPTIKPATESA